MLKKRQVDIQPVKDPTGASDDRKRLSPFAEIAHIDLIPRQVPFDDDDEGDRV